MKAYPGRIVVPGTADSKRDDLEYEKRTTMSMAYLAQPAQQQQLEWIDGGTLAILLDGKATNGQLMIGRFDVSEGEAPPYHKHTREDEVFMLIKGTALVWCDDQEMELSEGGIVYLPKDIPHAYRITSRKADLLMINTPAGIEGMFRYAGRDKSAPRPAGFEIRPELLTEASQQFGQIILGPPR
jgi:quercetin dioxygenase-like cupin family protein